MVQISKYLLNLDLKELLDVLEKDNDIDNTLIILQMLELNDLAALERLKAELLKEKDEEDELLSVEDEKKAKEEKEKIKKASAKCDRTHAVIQSILSQPMEFWQSNDVASFANSLLGTIIIPESQKERSSMAGGILFGIVKSKNKDIKLEYNERP